MASGYMINKEDFQVFVHPDGSVDFDYLVESNYSGSYWGSESLSHEQIKGLYKLSLLAVQESQNG